MSKKNTMSANDFTFWTVYGVIMITFLYRRFYAISDSSGAGELMLQAAGSVVLWFLLVRRNRNYSSVLLISLFPIVIREAVEYWEYVSVIPAITGAAVLIALAMALMLGKKRARDARTRRGQSIAFKRTFLKAFTTTACLIMLAGVVYGRSAHIRQLSVLFRSVVADYEAENALNNDENTLANNIETLSRLDPRGGWNTLSLDEKADTLEAVIRVECRYLGMQDTLPNLNIAYTKRDELLGFYDRESDTITISYDYLMESKANGYSICQVLCHELYHRMQFYQIEMLEALEASENTEKYADLLLMHDTVVYRSEAGNYVDGKDNYYLYATQQLERDADAYGNEAVQDYYNANQDYFTKQEQTGKAVEYEPAA